MSLIFFQGLNCYLASMINVAVFVGVDYQNIFADLWSETDFTYDQVHHQYLSKRMPKNLASMGMNLDFLNCCSMEEKKKNISALPLGQWLIAGMDAFFIPWVPFYQTIHSYHYFIARKDSESVFSCFDPTYDKHNLEITKEHMVSYTFDLCRIRKSAEEPYHREIQEEAQIIIDTHLETQEKLLAQIMECAFGNHKNGELLAKYVDALINNRYMYLYYLQNMPLSGGRYDQYFCKEFFQKWTAVKNGLYKASLSKDNRVFIDEVCGHFKELIKEEMNIAMKIAVSL